MPLKRLKARFNYKVSQAQIKLYFKLEEVKEQFQVTQTWLELDICYSRWLRLARTLFYTFLSSKLLLPKITIIFYTTQ